MARQNPRHRDHDVELEHDVADLARMLGTEPGEAVDVLHVMSVAGFLKLHHDGRWPDPFKRFTVARFDVEGFHRIIRDGWKFQDLQDVLGIQRDDDE